MKTKLGLTTLSAACIGLATLGGCMGVDRDEQAESASNQNRIQFVQESSAGLATAAATANLPDISALGCPNLETLFDDIATFQGSVSQPLPQSFDDYLSCFGISGSPTLDDYDGVWEKLQNPTELLDCVCGSSALSDLFRAYGVWTVFSAQASAAAGAAFNASQSNASGSTFDATNSNAGGSGFDATSSNAGGSGFSAE